METNNDNNNPSTWKNYTTNRGQKKYSHVVQSQLLNLKKKKQSSSTTNKANEENQLENQEKLSQTSTTLVFKPKLPTLFYVTKLRDWSEEIPIIGISLEWQQNIFNLIPQHYKNHYQPLLTQLMDEIKNSYTDEMQKIAIESIVIHETTTKTINNLPNKNSTLDINKQKYYLFNSRRKSLNNKYLLSHNLIKFIIRQACMTLPPTIVDLKSYHTQGVLNMSDLRDAIKKIIKNQTLKVKNNYYKEIATAIKNLSLQKKINDDKKSIIKFLHCLENIFKQQILNLMLQTIDDIINTLDKCELQPQIKFKLICENCGNGMLSINPSIEQVIQLYNEIIKDIENIAQHLLPFECYISNISTKQSYIDVEIPEWFITKARDDLQIIIKRTFKPMYDDFSKCNDLNFICNLDTKKNILKLISEQHDFTIYYKQVELFNNYLTKINSLPNNIYYKIGQLNQSETKETLKKIIHEINDILINKLISYHLNYNKNICNEFEKLKYKALNIPNNTKNLFELSEHMALASTIIIDELENKIRVSIEMLSALMQITTISDEHMELNKNTINWLTLIKDIFNQSNNLCENMKSELEDELQKKINYLNIQIDNLVPGLVILDDMDDAQRVGEYIEFLDILVRKINTIDCEISAINMDEKLFKFPETQFTKIDEIKDIILPFYHLIQMVHQWSGYKSVWLNGPYESINANEVEKITIDYYEKFTDLNQTFKKKIKSDMQSPNKAFRFSGIIDDPDPMQQSAPLKLCYQALENVKEFKQYIPLVNCMCNTALASRHWNEMSIIYGNDLTPNAGTTLRKIIALNLMKDIDKYQVISISANKELLLQQQLESMINEWTKINFKLKLTTIKQNNKNSKLIFIHYNDIQQLLEHHLIIIEEMISSYFVKPIANQVNKLYQSLLTLKKMLKIWNLIQDECISLQQIFNNNLSSTLSSKLEQLSNLYTQVINIVTTIKTNIMSNPTFISITKYTKIYLKQLTDLLITIETINIGINQYLENIRLSFSRFYFLSNSEIINILFNQSITESQKIQNLLQKCFTGINKINVNLTNNNIIGITSNYNEQLMLKNSINCHQFFIDINNQDKNNNSLYLIESIVINSIHDKIYHHLCLNNSQSQNNTIDKIYQLSKNTTTLQLINECLIKLFLTASIDNCFIQNNDNNTDNLKLLLNKQSDLVNNLIIYLKDKHHPVYQRIILTSSIVSSIYHRDILKLLMNSNVTRANDFNWIAQLRYYWLDDNVKVTMINDTKNYNYEFLSADDKPFINTPLTDRCYRTLFQAWCSDYHGTLVGSAGAGKIETLKNLSRALATKLHIIHCTKYTNHQYLNQMFKGFIASNCWLSFKNANHLKSTILSSLIHTIYSISKLLNSNLKTIPFEGTIFPVKQSSNKGFITITINLGHSTSLLLSKQFKNHLPDNYKVMFRTVSFNCNPDIAKICETKLFASGFTQAHELSNKIIQISKFCSTRLSQQIQTSNNFSYRTINSILKTAINLKFKLPEINDEMIIIRSLMDINLPNLMYNDIIIFKELIQNLFPKSSQSILFNNYDNLLSNLDKITQLNNIELHETFKLKIIQIFEMSFIKHGFIVVGDSLSGKTTIIESFINCLSILKLNNDACDAVKMNNVNWINQNCMTVENLFGYTECKSEKWYDGILTSLIRDNNNNDHPNNDTNSNTNQNKKESKIETNQKWIIFDGPVNNSWMDYLSTLLSTDKQLFLVTGEAIKLKNNTSIIFETDNLNNATPSIVSQCGTIYIDNNSVGWKPHIKSWIINQKFSNNNNKHELFFTTLFNWVFTSTIQFIAKNNYPLILQTSDIYLVTSTLKLLNIILQDAYDTCTEDKDKSQYFEIWCQAALTQSIVWTFTSCIPIHCMTKLNEFCISLWSNEIEDNPRPELLKQFDLSLPIEGLIHDNKYVFKAAGNWRLWSDIFKSDHNMDIEVCEFSNLIVPTIDIIKYLNIFKNHIKYQVPFIINGQPSTGKTSSMKLLLKKKLSDKKFQSNIFNFSPGTQVTQAKNCFTSKLNKLIREKDDKTSEKICINFVDDLNLLSLNTEHPILDLIRQFINHKYWYTHENGKHEKMSYDNIFFICGLTQETNQIKNLSKRFLSHFNFYTMYNPSKETISRIFSNILFFNLKKNQFSSDIIGTINSIVNSIIHVYINIKDYFKLSMTNEFYHQLDLKDILRVINGCSLIHRESVETKITLIRLWVHESLRVFGDRISTPSDYEFLLLKIEEAVKIFFKDTLESVFDHLPRQNDKLTSKSFTNLIFTNFMDVNVSDDTTQLSSSSSSPRYEEVLTKDVLKNKVIFYLTEFNRLNTKKLDILILSDVLEHLIRICRVLSIPGGHLMMFCIGGTGRQSLTRLAAFIKKQDYFQLQPQQQQHDNHPNNLDTSPNKWNTDLKKILKICGGYDQDCIYFISCRHIKDIHLDNINSLLTTGEILDLISPEEKREIIEIARLPAQKGDRNLELKTSQVMDYFYNQCKLKLHFILYINNITNKKIINKYKLLKNIMKYCFIDYFQHWPTEAFTELGKSLIDTIQIDTTIKDKIITTSKYLYNESEKLQTNYYNQFNRIIHVYNPSAFIKLLKLFRELIANKQHEIMELRNKYLCGLNKLQLAAVRVNEMKTVLTSLRPQLEESANKTQDTMREIENENICVESTTIQVKRDEEVANKKAKIASTLKLECEADLAVAIPILEDAIAALNTLKPTDITLVKAMKNPPDTVKLVMAAVCVMLGVNAEKIIDPITGRKSMDFWGPSKRVLSDMNFLQNLKDYDKDNISPSIMQIIKKTYMTDKSFMPHIVAKASSAAEGLCKWVRAMVSYDEVVKVVAPKKEKLAAAEKECNETIAYLNDKRKILSALNDKLTALNENLKLTLANKMDLENEIARCTERLVRAEALIKSLGGEKCKWMQSADNLKTSYDNLPGDLILSCAIVVYLSPCHLGYRDTNISKWIKFIRNLGITSSTNYNFVKVMESNTETNPWYCHRNIGLISKNRFYAENAVILNNTKQFCLFIDPEYQANLWIKKIEQKNKLKIIKLNDTNYLDQIKQNIEFGYPTLIENIHDNFISLSLESILSLNVYTIDEKLYCDFNNDIINYNPQFRLYITTRYNNPIYEPYIFTKLTIINFLLPTEVIHNKLLDIIASRERPELQETYDALLIQSISNKRLLKQEENNILDILSTSTVNILEDENSIMILDSSKNLSSNIMIKQNDIQTKMQKIDDYRNNYHQLTYYCADLYQTLMSLSNLNTMYKFSYHWFIQLYIKSISSSSTSVILNKRLDYLKASFTKMLHDSVISGLYEKHKLLYTFIMSLKISLNNKTITQEEYIYFMDDIKQMDSEHDQNDSEHNENDSEHHQRLPTSDITTPKKSITHNKDNHPTEDTKQRTPEHHQSDNEHHPASTSDKPDLKKSVQHKDASDKADTNNSPKDGQQKSSKSDANDENEHQTKQITSEHNQNDSEHHQRLSTSDKTCLKKSITHDKDNHPIEDTKQRTPEHHQSDNEHHPASTSDKPDLKKSIQHKDASNKADTNNSPKDVQQKTTTKHQTTNDDKTIPWLPEKIINQLTKLSRTFTDCHDLIDTIKTDESWRDFFYSPNTSKCSLPQPSETKLSSFRKLMIIKILRIDKLPQKIIEYVTPIIGPNQLNYLHTSPINLLSNPYLQSNCLTPLMFILPSYTEPLKLLNELAYKLGHSSKLHVISSLKFDNSPEQQLKLQNLILNYQKNGDWIFFQDCHLTTTESLSQLEKIYDNIQQHNTNLEFRLWLSTCPNSKFPINIIQESIKITTDTPLNFKKCLLHCYHQPPLNSPNFFIDCSGKNKTFAKLLYALSFFHCVILQRNNFFNQSWNTTPYDFNHYDLSLSAQQLKMLLLINSESYNGMKYLIGECNYAGTIIDNHDKNCLTTILQDYLNEKIIKNYNYIFSGCPNDYFIPDRCEYTDYIKHINNIKNYTSSQVFGVNETTFYQRDTLIANHFCDSLTILNEHRPRLNETTRDDEVGHLINDIKGKLPSELLIVKSLENQVAKENCSVMRKYIGLVLIDEIVIYNKIINQIINSLIHLTQEDINKISTNIVPTSWLLFTPDPNLCKKKLSKFIINLNKQFDYLKKLINNPSLIYFGGFKYPNRLLTAAKIIFSKQTKIPIDKLNFNFIILPSDGNTDLSNEQCLYLNDLYLCGGMWNIISRKLVVNNPRIMFNKMPIVQCQPVQQQQQLHMSTLDENEIDRNYYACPLYKSNVERHSIYNFIMDIPMPTDLTSECWIKSGAAIFSLIE